MISHDLNILEDRITDLRNDVRTIAQKVFWIWLFAVIMPASGALLGVALFIFEKFSK